MSYTPTPAEIITTDNTVQLDAFSRKRVSDTFAHARLLQLHDNLPELFSRVNNGTGNQSYIVANNKTIMSTVASGDYAIAQTFQRFPYSAFDSQIWAVTASSFDVETNVDKRIGYFNGGESGSYDSYDGMFFSALSADAEIATNIYKNGVQIRHFKQSEWNIDKLDGNGPSGINFSAWDKNVILGADFQYLGLGRVRWYADIGGQLVLLHEDNNAFADLDEMYMGSPNQPIRYEIRQTGVGSGFLNQFCAAVSKEGSTNNLGLPKVVRNPITTTVAVGSTNLSVLLGIRLKSTHLDAQVRLLDVSTFVTNNTPIQWYLYRNPSITGTALTWNGITNSALEYAIGVAASVVTENIAQELASDCTAGRSGNEKLIETALRLGSAIDGTPDEFILCAKSASGTGNTVGTINYLTSL